MKQKKDARTAILDRRIDCRHQKLNVSCVRSFTSIQREKSVVQVSGPAQVTLEVRNPKDRNLKINNGYRLLIFLHHM